MGTAVAKKEEAGLPADLMDDIFDHAGEGASFDSSEMQIPFVRLLQALSPQLSKKKSEFIEGAAAGDIFNNVTGQFWPGEDGITVIPCFQTTKYLEFTPREQGGGFRGEIAPNDPMIQQAMRQGGKEILPNGNELVKSDQHFCLIVEADGAAQPAVIDMKSTQLKVSRRWKTQIAMKKIKNPKTGQLVTPPVFATQWKLRAIEESNDKGDFYNWVVEPDGLVSDASLFAEAKAFRQSVAAGEVKAQAEDHGPAASPHVNDADEIPF